MFKILKTINAKKNKNRILSFGSIIDNSEGGSYYDSIHIQFNIENELKISKNILQEFKIKYNNILERFNNIPSHESHPLQLFSFEESSFKTKFPDGLLTNSSNDHSQNITSLLDTFIELEDWKSFPVVNLDSLETYGVDLIKDADQAEFLYQLCELYDIAEKIEKHQYNESRLTNLIYKVLKKSWVCLIDIRSVFRRIIRFLFKNLDDEHDSFINTYRVNKSYQSSLNFA